MLNEMVLIVSSLFHLKELNEIVQKVLNSPKGNEVYIDWVFSN